MANSFNFFPVHSSSQGLNENTMQHNNLYSKYSNSSMLFFGNRKSRKKPNDN